MEYKVILDKKDGNLWDITKLVSKATLKFKRVGSCGTLKLNLQNGDVFQSTEFNIEEGDAITLQTENYNMFRGYVFKNEKDISTKERTITVYDQVKYLLYNYSYVFINKKASEILTQIAKEFKLEIGNIEDTNFVIPKLVEDDVKLLDIIVEALGVTSDNTGMQYCLYDNFGKLELRSVTNMITDFILSDESHITGGTYSSDIENSYSRFKIVQDNKDTGKREVYIAENSELINKWGILQYFEVAQEGLNPEQIKQKLNTIAELKSRKTQELRIKAVGEFVRAGQSIGIILQEENIKQYFRIEEVEHSFEGGNVHNMDVTLYI